MPYTFILIVGLVFYSGVIDKVKDSKNKTVTEVVTSKPVVVKSTPKSLEPTKEEAKVELKQPEPIKEEAKVELKQPEPIKEEVTVELNKTKTDEPKIAKQENNYFKIILYIIAAIATIFGGFYFFSSRSNGQTVNSKVDTERKDIEENYVSESEESQPSQLETQADSQEEQSNQEDSETITPEQQPAQNESQPKPQEEQFNQEDSETTTPEQQPAQNESQPEPQEQQSDDEDENNNK